MNGTNYSIYRERYAFLRDSYWGGDRYRYPSATNLASAASVRVAINQDGVRLEEIIRHQSYLVPHPRESEENFLVRLKLAIYVNVVAPIVDAYAEACTTKVTRDLGALDVSNVDCQQRDWSELVEDAARWSALYGWILAVVDTPKADAVPATLAEEQAAGIKPRIVIVEPAAIAWIKTDGVGQLKEVAYVEEAWRDDAKQNQSVRIRIIRSGEWELRKGTFPLTSEISNSYGDYDLIEKGALSERLRGRLPVHPLFYRRVAGPSPLGQSLVEDAADIARAIYNALSWANETHRKAGFPFLAVPLAATGGQMDAATARTIGPSNAFPYDSNTGAPSWVQPSAESTQELREHCGWLFQMALRTAGLEVAADSSAQVQSGEALRIRSRDFESRAARFARNLQRWETNVLEDFATLAGEAVEPKVSYPKRFTLPDPSEELASALSVLKDVPVEIGPVPKARAVVQALRAALGLSDEEATEYLDQLTALYSGDLAEFNEDRKARAARRLIELRAAGSVNSGNDRPAADGANTIPAGATDSQESNASPASP